MKMNVLFACENTKIMNMVKEEFENKYKDTLNISFVSELHDTTEDSINNPRVIIGLYSSSTKFLNEYTHLLKCVEENGSLKGYESMFSVNLIPYLHELIDDYSKVSSALDKIQKEDWHIHFKKYSFGGGKGDEHEFEIKDNNKNIIGTIGLQDVNDNIRISLVDEPIFWLDEINRNGNNAVMVLVDNIIGKALLRDDKEYCSKFNNGESVYLPLGFFDIYREEMFTEDENAFVDASTPFVKFNTSF